MTVDLFRPFMSEAARRAVQAVLTPDPETGRLFIGQGPMVDAFEKALITVISAPRDVLTVNSGTSALDLALHLCGVGTPESVTAASGYMGNLGAVVSTPLTCTATNTNVVTRGGQIVWADVDPWTGLISPRSVAEALERYPWWDMRGSEIKAVIAVDWGGHLCDYPALRWVTDPYSIPIIQDAAHSFGATVRRRPFLVPAKDGTLYHGDFVAFSFQAIKALTTVDGGALICPNDEETERARLLRWYGLDRRKGEAFRCLHRRAVVRMVAGPNLSIRKIVNERIEGEVWATDDYGNLTRSRITGWHKSKRDGRRFMRLSIGENATIMTDDHEVLTPFGYRKAGRLESGDYVASGYPSLSNYQRSVIIGSLMGDASLSVKSAGTGRAVLQEQHTSEQDEYIFLKVAALKGLGVKTCRSAPYFEKNRPNGATHYRTPSLPVLGEMREAFYINGRKIVPKSLLEDNWSPLLMACWFMDDGHTRVINQKDGLVPGCQIATNGFAEEDVEWLAQFLESRGLPCVARQGRLYFTKAGSLALTRLIAPYVPPSMRYKVAHRTDIEFDPSLWGDGSSPVDYVRCRIEPYDDDDDTVYCITTEHGNFCTTTATVHNCSQGVEEAGYKYHMNDVAAAIGLANLPHVQTLLSIQWANAHQYLTLLDGLPGVVLPKHGQSGSAWWLFTLLVSDRDGFEAFMAERGVMTSQVHARNDKHPAFIAATCNAEMPLPGVDFFAAHQVSIPVGWWLSAADRDLVISSVREWSERYGRPFGPEQDGVSRSGAGSSEAGPSTAPASTEPRIDAPGQRDGDPAASPEVP